MEMLLCPPFKVSICDNTFCAIPIQYFTQNSFIFYVGSIQHDHLITDETIIWLYSCLKEIYVLYFKT